MKHPFATAVHYLRHRVRSRSKFDLHSPFIYNFYSGILRDRSAAGETQSIEKMRNRLLKEPGYIKMSDLGAGAGEIPWCRRLMPVSKIVRRSCVSPAYGRILFLLSRKFHPAVTIELGTSLGISTSYLALGNPSGKVITIEGCPETAGAARRNFEALGLTNIRQITGSFEEELPLLLKELGKVEMFFIDGNHRKDATLNYFSLCLQHIQNDSVLILDDIHWSDEMETAWNEIRLNPSVTVTIDLFRMGLVFFDKGLSKEDFILHL